MDSYQSLSAKVYDFDKPVGTSFGDIEFYTAALHRHGVKSDVLEPAVGTGRFMIPLLKSGFSVEGFDLSADMLALCQENLKQHQLGPEIVHQAAFHNFHYANTKKFEAVVIPSGTFLLMTDYAEINQALANFHTHLGTGGLLIFDIFLQPHFQVGKSTIRQYPLSDTHKISLTMTEAEIDHINQVTTTYHRYDEWKNHVLIKSELEVFRLKWLGIHELMLLLQAHGFTDIEFCADYDLQKKPSNTAEIITVSAIKSTITK